MQLAETRVSRSMANSVEKETILSQSQTTKKN